FSLRQVLSNFDNFSPTVLAESFTTPLYLNSFYGSEAILMVHFPKKRSYIMKSNRGLLFSSFLFVFLIAMSFGASILVIFRQKKLSELKTDFINNMTHELKTPVATISLATEMLGKEKVLSDANRVKNYTTIIGDENKRLGNHIEKVLQIAQLDKEELKLKNEDVNIHDLIDELLKKFKLRIEAAQADVSIETTAEEYISHLDKTHLLNVFSNLLDNSLKYRRDESLNISIRTYSNSKGINIEFADNGVGMNAASQKKIFTRFYRVPTGNIHNVKGFGLGLSYVKTMIDAFGGNISVDSELNKYTKFTITLPTI
ncbi:MAG: sensor histidine kinase, partial [Chitinophagales bacterium]